MTKNDWTSCQAVDSEDTKSIFNSLCEINVENIGWNAESVDAIVSQLVLIVEEKVADPLLRTTLCTSNRSCSSRCSA
ncbi:hypothetical protein EON64_05830 [archaeon]|nr:MAG: hypothetical protein EON64_05830 [archaeon]